MSELFKNYIAGEWNESSTGGTFERRNPATGELVGVFTKSGPDDVDRAVAAAKRAFETWRLYPAPKRGEILFKVARILEDRKDALAREMTEEMGKVLTEARGDVQEAIDMAYYMAGEGRRMLGQTTPSEMREQVPDVDPQAARCLSASSRPGTSRWRFPPGRSARAIVTGNTVSSSPRPFTAAGGFASSKSLLKQAFRPVSSISCSAMATRSAIHSSITPT